MYLKRYRVKIGLNSVDDNMENLDARSIKHFYQSIRAINKVITSDNCIMQGFVIRLINKLLTHKLLHFATQ